MTAAEASFAPGLLENDLSLLLTLARPHLLAITLACARIVPIAFLCPLFGGSLCPVPARLALSLALAAHVHLACGVLPACCSEGGAVAVVGAFAAELFAGLSIGFVATLPFDAARIGGRCLDTLRGANGEAALPAAGSREAATGDFLYQLLVALAAAGHGWRLLACAILTSFKALPLGSVAAPAGEAVAMFAARQATAALGAGLAIGAPVAAIALVLDLVLAVATRAAPALSPTSLAPPIKLLAGGVAICLAIGIVSERLLAELAASAAAVSSVTALAANAAP